MTKIQLQSNDNETFEVDRDVIRLSTTLNTMFQGTFPGATLKRLKPLRTTERLMHDVQSGSHSKHKHLADSKLRVPYDTKLCLNLYVRDTFMIVPV